MTFDNEADAFIYWSEKKKELVYDDCRDFLGHSCIAGYYAKYEGPYSYYRNCMTEFYLKGSVVARSVFTCPVNIPGAKYEVEFILPEIL